jgi:hypothetical protein
MRTNINRFLVEYHIAELTCGILAVIVSFISFNYGWKTFWITTALSTISGVLVATLLERIWKNQTEGNKNG